MIFFKKNVRNILRIYFAKVFLHFFVQEIFSWIFFFFSEKSLCITFPLLFQKKMRMDFARGVGDRFEPPVRNWPGEALVTGDRKELSPLLWQQFAWGHIES
jgi:hypothetical protein